MVILNSLSGPNSPCGSEPLWWPEIRRTDRADQQILTPRTCGVNRKPPQSLVVPKEICGKNARLPNPPPASSGLVTLSHPPHARKKFSSPYVVKIRTAKSKNSSHNGDSHAKYNHQFQCGRQYALSPQFPGSRFEDSHPGGGYLRADFLLLQRRLHSHRPRRHSHPLRQGHRRNPWRRNPPHQSPEVRGKALHSNSVRERKRQRPIQRRPHPRSGHLTALPP